MASRERFATGSPVRRRGGSEAPAMACEVYACRTTWRVLPCGLARTYARPIDELGRSPQNESARKRR